MQFQNFVPNKEGLMPRQTYDIIFSGKLMEGSNLENARQQIGEIFKADDDLLNRLFSGNPVVVKSGVDDKTAAKYRVAFRNAGALIDIKPSTATSDNSNDIYPTKTPELTLLPPNTGSLIGYAKKVVPQPIPDISNISLASLGTTIDQSPDPKPAEIDTGTLSANPVNSGTLEDCKKDVEPYPIPDISHLDIDES
jgi:hypothetical protein